MDMAVAPKIGIIGLGHVGAHVANAVLWQGLAAELYLCDVRADKLAAETNDLQDAMAFYPHSARVCSVGDRYEALAECDIIVNAAGFIEKAAESRDGELFATTDAARTFAARIAQAGFDGVWLTISNPCDVVATALWHLGGFDPARIVGSGTALDSARFQHALAAATGFDPDSITAYMLGEHGASQFALWSHARFGALTAAEIEAAGVTTFDRPALEDAARGGGYVTMAGKHCTEYSVSNAAVTLLRAIVYDTKTLLPCSTLLTGQYGQSGHFISLPCIVGKNGVERVFTPELDPGEATAFAASCQHVQENIAKLSWW